MRTKQEVAVSMVAVVLPVLVKALAGRVVTTVVAGSGLVVPGSRRGRGRPR